MCRFFYATIYIGNPPKRYYLDIDTGSNLTWVQCAAGPRAKLLKVIIIIFFCLHMLVNLNT